MSRKSSQISISLFPFLAVLVCMMGALILLLLATTRRLRDVALAEVAASQVAAAESQLAATSVVPLPDPKSLNPNVSPPAEETPSAEEDLSDAAIWVSKKPAPVPRRAPAPPAPTQEEVDRPWQNYLEELQQVINASEQEAKDIAARLREMEKAVNALDLKQLEADANTAALSGKIASAKEALRADQTRAELEQQLAALKKQLSDQKEQATIAATKYAVTAFDPISGTTRRPILIECTDTHILFQPEGVAIHKADLEGFTQNVNPVMAGTKALVAHWTSWNEQQPRPDAEPDPYVLFIVRPSGIVAYYTARTMLSSLKTPIGYELVEADISLALPAVDPKAQTAVREAVTTMIAQRDRIMQQYGSRPGSAGPGVAASTGNEPQSAMQGGRPSRPGQGNAFELKDKEKASVTDSSSKRSWENISRFEGQQYRRGSRPEQLEDESASGNSKPEMKPVPEPREQPAMNRPRSQPVHTEPGLPPSPAGPTQQYIATSEPEEPAKLEASHPGEPRRRALHNPLSKPIRNAKPSPSRSIQPVETVHSSIQLERSVTVEVTSTAIHVQDSVIPLARTASLANICQEIVSASQTAVREWGDPPAGFSWAPSLKLVATPGSLALVEQLSSRLIEQGVPVHSRFRIPEEDSAPVFELPVKPATNSEARP